MNETELNKLIKEGESERLEFKRSTGQRTEAAKTVCAMLNGAGGMILFGVTDGGEPVGQQVSTRTLADITHELRRIDPPNFPNVETIGLKNGKTVIALHVAGGGGPYTYDGRPYHRHGPTTGIMPKTIYHRKIEEYLHPTSRWENQPAPPNVSIDDLDKREIQITVDNAIRLGRMDQMENRDTVSVLRGLGLIENDQLLAAAVALYGKSDRLQAIYPQFSVRLARFRGVNRLGEFIDNRQYWGHAFSLLRRAEMFLGDHVPIAGRLVPGRMQREDRPLYPPLATREAVANAICHRDYVSHGGSIGVAMYDDRLEIINTGTFHFGMTPEKLKTPHDSHPWNPIIAGVFYRAGIIEKWGSGTLKILDWCREGTCPDPIWEDQEDAVVVTFLPAQPFEEGAVQLTDKKRLGIKLGIKLGINAEKILEAMSENSHITARELSDRIGISATAIDAHIKKLKEFGIVTRKGARKSGYWEVHLEPNNANEPLTK